MQRLGVRVLPDKTVVLKGRLCNTVFFNIKLRFSINAVLRSNKCTNAGPATKMHEMGCNSVDQSRWPMRLEVSARGQGRCSAEMLHPSDFSWKIFHVPESFFRVRLLRALEEILPAT